MKRSIAKDTVRMTLVDVVLQGATLLVNAFLTRRLGEETVGVLSLVSAFYGTFVVVSNGNSFLCANRFVSEERGKAVGNPSTVLAYAVLWSGMLSLCSATLLVAASNGLCVSLLGSVEYSRGVRVVASTLVLTAVNSSVKGYFHAYRRVTVPLVAGCIEFSVRNLLTVVTVCRLSYDVVTVLAVSILFGEVASMAFLAASLLKSLRRSDSPTDTSFWRYVRRSLPIALNSSIPSVLSTCNDALLPITLRRCGSSSEESFGMYGTFEAIVIPILFFPSSILCSLSCIVVTEVARCNSAGDYARVRRVCYKAIRLTLAFSLVVAVGLYLFGDDVAVLIGSTPFSGRVVQILSPVVPLIYLEITLESVLKGLGRHGFSSMNYVAEYVVRISTLLVSVPLFHFYGIVVSYYASNVVGNLARMVEVYRVIPREPRAEAPHVPNGRRTTVG